MSEVGGCDWQDMKPAPHQAACLRLASAKSLSLLRLEHGRCFRIVGLAGDILYLTIRLNLGALLSWETLS